MLPAYIIEQLRRREEARREQSKREQPRVEVPLPPRRPAAPDAPREERGVAIIPVFDS